MLASIPFSKKWTVGTATNEKSRSEISLWQAGKEGGNELGCQDGIQLLVQICRRGGVRDGRDLLRRGSERLYGQEVTVSVGGVLTQRHLPQMYTIAEGQRTMSRYVYTCHSCSLQRAGLCPVLRADCTGHQWQRSYCWRKDQEHQVVDCASSLHDALWTIFTNWIEEKTSQIWLWTVL